MAKSVFFSRDAVRTLRSMPVTDARRIRSKIDQYATNPASLAANVRKLQGVDLFRLRVGDWRVIFNEDLLVVSVIKIGPRGGVYR